MDWRIVGASSARCRFSFSRHSSLSQSSLRHSLSLRVFQPSMTFPFFSVHTSTCPSPTIFDSASCCHNS
ncbi:hypothetical protein S83_038957 [Arachis hypogaea]